MAKYLELLKLGPANPQTVDQAGVIAAMQSGDALQGHMVVSIAPQLEDIFGRKALYAGRDASASPAAGSLALPKLELAALLKQAFTL